MYRKGLNLELNVGVLVLTTNPTPDRELDVEYASDSREVVIRNSFPEPFVLSQGQGVVMLHIEQVELRLSEEAVRQLVDKLPPEMFH